MISTKFLFIMTTMLDISICGFFLVNWKSLKLNDWNKKFGIQLKVLEIDFMNWAHYSWVVPISEKEKKSVLSVFCDNWCEFESIVQSVRLIYPIRVGISISSNGEIQKECLFTVSKLAECMKSTAICWKFEM